MIESNDDAVPRLEQAEAYCSDHYVLICNSKTEVVVDITKRAFGKKVEEVPDFQSFLHALGTISHRGVLVALGDSTTANYANWAAKLAFGGAARQRNLLVVNLADWSKTAVDHVYTLQFFLKWLRERSDGKVQVVFVGGLTDIHERYFFYHRLINHGHSGLLPGEEDLETHRYGATLARLNGEIPVEEEEVSLWLARRALAAVRMLERLCVDANADFAAVLHPLAYEDYAPGYLRTLRRLYDAATTDQSEFEDWCRQRGYFPDPSAALSQDLRPGIEALRTLWSSGVRDSSVAPAQSGFVDYVALFQNTDTSCFNEHFDALHLGELGAGLLAEAISGLLHITEA